MRHRLPNNSPILLRFLGAVNDLDCLPCYNMAVFPGAEYAVQHAADGAQRHVTAVQRRQRAPFECSRLGKEDFSGLCCLYYTRSVDKDDAGPEREQRRGVDGSVAKRSIDQPLPLTLGLLLLPSHGENDRTRKI